MLNTNEKYLKINVLVNSIEEDIDDMINKAMKLKNNQSKAEIIDKKDIDSIADISESIKLTTKNIEILESFKEENDFSDVENKTEIDLNEYNYFKKEDDTEEKVFNEEFSSELNEEFNNEKQLNNLEKGNNVEIFFKEEDLNISDESIVMDNIESKNIEVKYNPDKILAKVFFFDGTVKEIELKDNTEINNMFIKRMNKHSNLKKIDHQLNKNDKRKPLKKNKIKYQIEKIIDFIKNIIKRK